MKNIKMLTAIALLAIMLVTKAEAQKKPPPPPPPPAKAHHENGDPQQRMNEFLKDNPMVSDIYWKKENLVVVVLKNGKTEKYNLINDEEKKSFLDEYGIMPTFLPPPPPPPPPPLKM